MRDGSGRRPPVPIVMVLFLRLAADARLFGLEGGLMRQTRVLRSEATLRDDQKSIAICGGLSLRQQIASGGGGRKHGWDLFIEIKTTFRRRRRAAALGATSSAALRRQRMKITTYIDHTQANRPSGPISQAVVS